MTYTGLASGKASGNKPPKLGMSVFVMRRIPSTCSDRPCRTSHLRIRRRASLIVPPSFQGPSSGNFPKKKRECRDFVQAGRESVEIGEIRNIRASRSEFRGDRRSGRTRIQGGASADSKERDDGITEPRGKKDGDRIARAIRAAGGPARPDHFGRPRRRLLPPRSHRPTQPTRRIPSPSERSGQRFKPTMGTTNVLSELRVNPFALGSTGSTSC